MKKIFAIGLLFGITLIVLPGCKKGTGNALLTLRFHSRMDTALIVPGTSYLNSLGQNISISRTSYYISNIQLTTTDGTIVPVTGIALVTSATSDYNMGNIPLGNYKSVSFNIGLVSNNHDDPANHSGSDPMAAQTPSMHFANDSLGYIFMAVEGLVDSNASGTPNKVFSYHIGTDGLLKTVTMADHSSSPFVASSNGLTVIDIVADFKVLTKNVSIKNNPITNTSDYPALADSLAQNIPAMFRYAQ